MNKAGSIVWIVGGGSGIGKAIAIAAAAQDALVYISGRRELVLKELESGPDSAQGRIIAAPCDAADGSSIAQVAKRLMNEHGRIDTLVVSTGKAIAGSLRETSLTDWNDMFRNHMDAAFLACKHALKGLENSEDGNILLIGSVFGLCGKENRLAYASVKGAMVNFVRSLALDLAGTVRVNSICPGWVQTEMSMRLVNSSPDPEAALAERKAWHPMNQGGTPEDVAELAMYLMSPAARWMTGQNIALDGGYSAR